MKMFFVSVRFLFGGRLSFYFFCYWKIWNEQTTTMCAILGDTSE